MPPSPPGEPLGRVDLVLTKNLLAVEEMPRALEGPLTPLPTAGTDVSGLPPGTWLHGKAPLTKTESVNLAVASDRKMLYFDSNRDGRYDATERCLPDSVLGNMAWFSTHAIIRQEFDGKPHQHDAAMKVGVHLQAPQVRSRLDCYRLGSFKGPTRVVKIAVEDRTFRGWFTHPGLDAILVDIDGDGAFDASADSTERYRLGEPFPLDGIDAVVTAIAPLGTTLDLARSPKAARRIVSLKIGAPAPTFEVHLLDGKPWKLEGMRGKWVLLDFWATWCGPCRGEIPNLKKSLAEHADLVVLGLSADRARAALEQYVASERITWPQVLEEAVGVQRTYRVASYPTSFLIDPDGRIAARDLRGPDLSAQIARIMVQRSKAMPPARQAPAGARTGRSK